MNRVERMLRDIENGANYLGAYEKEPRENYQPVIGTVPNQNFAAAFDIIVTRNGINTLVPLPFVMFGAEHLASAYIQMINENLPAGVTFVGMTGTILTAGSTDQIIFTYNIGGNDDTVVLTCSQVPYTAFVNATLGGDLFKMSKILISLSDATQLTQFNQPFIVSRRSLFGLVNNNALNVGSYRKPTDFQTGIVELPHTIYVDKEVAIISKIIAVNAFAVTYNCFVERFSKYNTESQLK